jgi:HNH endonuclease
VRILQLRQEHDRFHLFHIEHIIARQHRGGDEADNLALASHQCNLHKGTNLSSFDPDTNQIVNLYHPRRARWPDHFKMDGPLIVGLTRTGRTTAWLLQMNSEERLEWRRILVELGELD